MAKEFCCKEFEENTRDNGGFEIYDKEKEVNVGGCCGGGGGCFVLGELKFCPYCGNEIKFI